MKTILVPTQHIASMRAALEAAVLLARRTGAYIEGFPLRIAIPPYVVAELTAGLTMDAARVGEFRHAINEIADETLGPDELMPRLRIDGDLTFRGITGGVAAGVAALAPFGAGNPRPVFSRCAR